MERKKAQWNHFAEKHLHTKNWYRCLLRQKSGFQKYSIVSACFNVEKYISKYIESLINQRLDFKNNIYLICVDEGSTDRTAEIIKHYARQYPDNIIYIYKENGGQASARNLGFQYVKTEWVSFCDPDDFLEYNAIYYIDRAIKKYGDIALVSMNFIFFMEDIKRFEDGHPLRYRFASDERVLKIANLGRYIQMSASTAFFKASVIRKNKLKQSELIKPVFEDAHFVAKYLSYVQDCRATFIKKSKYFYRKRKDGSSSLDKSWVDVRRFYDVFKYGHLDVLEHYKKYCPSNDYAKRICIYDFIWHLMKIVDNGKAVDFLTDFEKERYVILLKKVFQYISVDDIHNITLNDGSLFRKVGMINCFKNEDPNVDVIFLTNFDSIKNEARFVYFGVRTDQIEIKIEEDLIKPSHETEIKHDFCGEIFTKEKIFWVPLTNKGFLRIFVSSKKAIISMKGKRFLDGLDTLNIAKELAPEVINNPNNGYKNAWLFSDRVDMADDNAEHLYRWVSKNYPDKKIYFIIDNQSNDWNRLISEGFNLIPYMSDEHKKALLGASVVISSQANKTELNPFDQKIGNAKFVFLQHGITKDDLHKWLNPKKIDLFVTATKPEYDSIAGSDFNYRFTSKEVKLLGFPRFDNLILNHGNEEKIILVMPTWRNYLSGDNFNDSKYKKNWIGFLYSDKLNRLCLENDYKVIVQLHPNMRKFIDGDDISDYVRFSRGERYQELFLKSKILVTDYSSTAFDMAFLNKYILYFQFDENEFFSGNHSYEKGYYDYRKDGFGPVANNLNDLFINLESVMKSDIMNPLYQKRINETFILRDSRNSQRCFNAISEMIGTNLKN